MTGNVVFLVHVLTAPPMSFVNYSAFLCKGQHDSFAHSHTQRFFHGSLIDFFHRTGCIGNTKKVRQSIIIIYESIKFMMKFITVYETLASLSCKGAVVAFQTSNIA